MNSYIITYDLCGKNKDYSSLINEITKFNIWGKITESTWFVKCNQSAITIRDHLVRYIDRNDRLFVVESVRNAAWTNVICSEQYLIDNL